MAVKYKLLARQLQTLIENSMQNGIEKLPTEQELCTRYNLSRQTVRQALSLLESKGLITRRQGSGSYITGLLADPEKNKIAILLPNDQEYLYPALLTDIRQTLSGHGFSCQVFTTHNRIQSERKILLDLLDSSFRGIIAESCRSIFPNPNRDLYRALTAGGTPIVFLHNYDTSLSDCLYVKDDNISGSSLLVHHLAEQGHSAIGGLFRSDDLQGAERFYGFMTAMEELSLDIPDEHVLFYDFSDWQELQTDTPSLFLKKAVEETLASCTAVICHNDMIAYHLSRELQRFGRHLPADLAIASFDNSYLSTFGVPHITSLSHDMHGIGTQAATILLRKLKGLPATPQEIPWKLIVRESTAFHPESF